MSTVEIEQAVGNDGLTLASALKKKRFFRNSREGSLKLRGKKYKISGQVVFINLCHTRCSLGTGTLTYRGCGVGLLLGGTRSLRTGEMGKTRILYHRRRCV